MFKDDEHIENEIKRTIKNFPSVIKNPPKKYQKVKKEIKIPVHDILRVMAYPQPIAAKILNVSISTLKRRYYKLNFGRWPINSASFDDEQKLEMNIFSKKNLKDSLKDNSISSIINSQDQDEAYIDDITQKILKCVFELTT